MVLILLFKYYHVSDAAGYPIAHLDNTATKKQRAEIIKWFKERPMLY